MPSAVTKAELEALLNKRFDALTGVREKIEPQRLPSGIPELDGALGGLPRGSLSEVYGLPSSGRMSLALSLLAEAAARRETCAYVDACDTFDPASAARAGVDLDRLLWVRCGGRAGHAMQAADLLAQAGGFGVIVLDIAPLPPRIARHIPLVAWFRLRRAVESTPTVLLVTSAEPQAKQAASLLLEMQRREAEWSGAPFPSCPAPDAGDKPCATDPPAAAADALLRGVRVHAEARKPPLPVRAVWRLSALG